jgi:hypothetical protein
MAGLLSGHPRLPSLIGKKDVDARHEAGHDEGWVGRQKMPSLWHGIC